VNTGPLSRAADLGIHPGQRPGGGRAGLYVRTCGLRQSRYRGLSKTHVQHVLTALACNLTRVADWIAAPVTARQGSTRFHALCIAAT
jgi:IS5 family transposase